MADQPEYNEVRRWIQEFAEEAKLPVGEQELERLEVAGLGLEELELTGLQIVTLASTDRVGVKLLFLRPNQFFPQHRTPTWSRKATLERPRYCADTTGRPTSTCRESAAKSPKVSPLACRRPFCTVWKEVGLLPGQQYICPPNTWHWFQAGPVGAIVWSISSKATDAADQFNDPQVIRMSSIQASHRKTRR